VNNDQAYAEKVVTVESDVGSIVSVYSYLGLESFEQLAEANVKNPNLCIQFLSEPGRTPNRRIIAILSMYKLDVHQWAGFVQRMTQLRDKGLASDDELRRSVFPRLSKVIVEHYADSDVQSTLKNVLARDDLGPHTRSLVRDILSGEVWEQQKRFEQECCTPRER
jgi:hypothetical protein